MKGPWASLDRQERSVDSSGCDRAAWCRGPRRLTHDNRGRLIGPVGRVGIRCHRSRHKLHGRGPGSLRAVVGAAASGDTIVFDLDCTGASQITLSTEILITGTTVTVDGTGHDVTISGNDATRIFNAGANGTLTLKHLTLTHGSAGDGGALAVTGVLTLLEYHRQRQHRVELRRWGDRRTLAAEHSSCTGARSSATAPPMLGGAIFNNASTVTIATSRFTEESGRQPRRGNRHQLRVSCWFPGALSPATPARPSAEVCTQQGGAQVDARQQHADQQHRHPGRRRNLHRRMGRPRSRTTRSAATTSASAAPAKRSERGARS